MRNISANAVLNLKEDPISLLVHGSIITFRSDDQIEISEAVPQGTNESILILDLSVKEGTGPMKGTPKHFSFEMIGEDSKKYNKVTIRYSEESPIHLEIEIFG